MSENVTSESPELKRMYPVIPAEDLPRVRTGLVFYRVMAYVVGTLLIVLTLVAMPLKYLAGDDQWVTIFGVMHGWLYMVLIISAVNLGYRAKWGLKHVVGIALAGTVPFLSFVAEHYARKDVLRRLAASER